MLLATIDVPLAEALALKVRDGDTSSNQASLFASTRCELALVLRRNNPHPVILGPGLDVHLSFPGTPP
jgi:hypothetical protein